RHRLHGKDIAGAHEAAARARARGVSLRAAAGGCRPPTLGQARAGGRGELQRMDGGRADAPSAVPRSAGTQARHLRNTGASRARGGGRYAAIRIEDKAIRQERTPEHVRRLFLLSPAHCGGQLASLSASYRVIATRIAETSAPVGVTVRRRPAAIL